MNIDDELLEDLIHAYHASDEGKRPFDPGEMNNLEKLIKEGFIEITVCNEDERSPHKARTCRVKLAWLLPKGVDLVKKYFDENAEELVARAERYLENLNPRIKLIVKYLFSVALDPSMNYLKLLIPPPENSLEVLRKLLPDYVYEDYNQFMNLLKDLKLIDYASIDHIVSGWKGSVLVSAESLNWRLNRIKQEDLPLVLDLLLTAYANIYAEYMFIRFNLIIAKKFNFNDYLYQREKYFTFPERVLYQYSKLPIDLRPPIEAKWDKIFRNLERIHFTYYLREILDEDIEDSIVKIGSYLLGKYVEPVEKRMEITEKLIKTIVKTWIEKGELLGIEISDYSLDSLIREYESKHR